MTAILFHPKLCVSCTVAEAMDSLIEAEYYAVYEKYLVYQIFVKQLKSEQCNPSVCYLRQMLGNGVAEVANNASDFSIRRYLFNKGNYTLT